MGLASNNFGNDWRLGASDLKGVEIPINEMTVDVGTYGYRSVGIPGAITLSTGQHCLAPLLKVDSDANRANVETLVCLQVKADASTPYHAGTAVRCSGAAGAENGYICGILRDSSLLVIAKLVAGAQIVLGTYDVSGVLTASAADFYIRFRVNGTALKAKVWKYNVAEPAAWQLSTTDSSVSAAGRVGLYSQAVTANNAGFYYPGFLSVATNGETAPRPRTEVELRTWLNDDTQRRIILAEIEALGQTSGGSANPSYVLISNAEFNTKGSETPPNQCYDDVMIVTPIIRASANEQLVGRSTLTFGDLIIKNENGVRDHWLTWNWDGRSCEMYMGGEGWSKWDFFKFLVGTVYEAYAPQRDQIGFKIRDRGASLNLKVRSAGSTIREVIGGSDANAGAPRPITLGSVFNIEPVLKTALTLVYKFHDEGLTGTSGVAAVRDNGTALALTTGYTVQLANGEITLVNSPAGRITMDVVNDESASNAIKGGNQHRRMLQTLVEDRSGLGAGTCYLGPRSGSVTNFASAVYAGMYIRGDANLIDLLDEIVISAGGFWHFNAIGLFCASRLEIPTAPYDHTLIEDDLEMDLEIEKILLPSEAQQLGYDKNWTVQSDGLSTGVSAANKALYGATAKFTAINPSYSGLDQPANHILRRTPERRVTLFKNSADAVTEATRLDSIYSKATAIVRFTTLAFAPYYELGQSIFLTHSRYGFENGKAGMIIGYEKDYRSARCIIRMIVQLNGTFPITSGSPPIIPTKEFYNAD